MAITIYNLGEGPRATRSKRRALEQSDEWLSLKAKMVDGIKPFEEIVITFTAADKAKLKIKGPQRVFRDMAKEWIRKTHLPYSVEAYKSEGNDIIKVWNEPAITKDARALEPPRNVGVKVDTPILNKAHKKRRA